MEMRNFVSADSVDHWFRSMLTTFLALTAAKPGKLPTSGGSS